MVKNTAFIVINTFFQITNVGGFPFTKMRYMSNEYERAKDFFEKIRDESDFDHCIVHLDKVLVEVEMNKDVNKDDFMENVLLFEDFNSTPRLVDKTADNKRITDNVLIEEIKGLLENHD